MCAIGGPKEMPCDYWDLYNTCFGDFRFRISPDTVVEILLSLDEYALNGASIKIPLSAFPDEPDNKHLKVASSDTEQKKGPPQSRKTSGGEAPSDKENSITVRQIRQHYKIASFVAPYTNGLKPSGKGRWFIGRCPFHQPDTDPASKRKFWVDTEKGICGCFVPRCPANEKPMDVINFYAALKGLSNREAIEQLARSLC